MSRPYRQIRRQELRDVGDPVVVATFMRSGTHLTIDLLRRQFAAFRSWKFPGESLDSLYLPVDVLLPGWEPVDWNPERVLRVLRRPRRPILKTHFLQADLANLRSSQPEFAAWLDERATFLHVTRDIRQILPSLWAFLPDWQGADPAAPLDEAFVRAWTPQVRDHAAAWAARPGVHALTQDDLVRRPGPILSLLENWLGEASLGRLPLLPAPLRSRLQTRLLRIFAWSSPSTAILARRPTPPWDASWEPWLPPITA